jgi:hypothetical protein
MAKRNEPSRTPPHSIETEQALLGAALLSPAALEILATETEPDDFHRPAHAAVAGRMQWMWNNGFDRVDPVLVWESLDAGERGLLGEGNLGLVELLDWQSHCPATSNARKYARMIVDDASLRRLIAVASESMDLAYAGDPEAIDFARERIGTLETPIGNAEPSLDIEAFLAVEEEYDWIVPGLIERSDRTILTAPEGHGKSTLLRQMSVAIAAGMHPFEYYPFEMSNGMLPSVSIIDVENSAAQSRRKIRPMLDIDGVKRRLDPKRLRIETKGDGLDLTTRHDARWLMERIAANQPDLLVIGPVYKLYDGDPNDERLVRKVAAVLDTIRIRYQCALLIEAHSPHGENDRYRELRPFGSSLWRRWPEFGYGLQRDREDENAVWFKAWRGARDEREWPGRLIRSQPWPWGTGHEVGRPVHHDDDTGRYEPDEDF